MSKKNLLFVAGLVLSLLLFSVCKAKKVKTQAVPAEEKSAFYTFDATRDTVKKKTTFTLKSVTVANAKIKYKVDEARTKEPSYLKIEVTDQNNQTIKAVTEHPLFKRMEVFEETGQIESKLISLQHAEFTLRIPYFEAYKKITIVEVINFKEASSIILKNEK